MNLAQRDRKLIWHPFTQEQTAALPIPIVRGEGAYLYDENGKAYIDLISSWWVNLHGHAHPKIAEAIYEQAKKLEHVIFAGFTHEPAVTLCEQLKAILPSLLTRFFFSDNGSTAVETALKMAYQYWWNKGEKSRTLFLSFEGGYHGDTVGAMSLGQSSGFCSPFKELLFAVYPIPFPDTWKGDAEIELKEQQSLQALKDILQKHHSSIAAFIAEPLVQGASGMRMCRPQYLGQVIALLQSHGILVILDEVMTGFGRTGTTFAFQQVEICPDFLCLSKGLSGGFLPLALTITTESIYEAFLSKHFSTAFAHGHSYTANPLGCAAALASLELLLAPYTQEMIEQINLVHIHCLAELAAHHTIIERPRICGTIAAFDLNSAGYDCNQAQRLKKACFESGLLLRPLGDTVYILPPYCIKPSELQNVYSTMNRVLREILIKA